MSQTPVLCFSHCNVDVIVYALSIPDNCPVCDLSMSSSALKIPPFRLPCPLVHSFSAPYSITIKPTKGSFLLTYTKDDNLHVGITDSRGIVYDYDVAGISRSSQGWDQCVTVNFDSTLSATQRALWDLKLREFMTHPQWKAEQYDQDKWNCFDFALHFLLLIGIEKNADKAGFTETSILPKTISVAKYVSVYRRVCREGKLVLENTKI